FSTIDLDQVRCPSYAQDAPSTHGNYLPFSSTQQPDLPMAPGPSTPYSLTTTNYKAMSATHMACMQNPSVVSGGMANQMELPNGILVPPPTAGFKGMGIKNIVDGTSKTIIVAETKEPNLSSWYDGTTSWQVAVPICAGGMGASALLNYSNT